ncbi:MAG: hypothetical protein H5T99_01080 [Moorella sp. (in: Bacteria)]|nr:hypothetical protein [Moorella sp. (in: firmicutes)]
MVLRPHDILPSFRAGLFISPEVLWYYYDQSSKRTYTRENANDLSPIISSAHFLYKPQAALEDRILPPSLITTEEFWQNVWPRENGSPAKHFAADQILEQMRNSDYFRVLPEPSVIWQTVREGVRENRWVLYFANNDLVFGARELAELPASSQLYQTVQLWEYQAALEAGIYPRRGTDQTEAREISAAVLKARCWPLGAEQISAAALERAAREIWPDLGRPRFQELLEEGGRLGLWGLWVKDAQENYYTAEDSLPDVAVGDNFFLVAPGSALARKLDAFRPGRKPQPVSATGTPREVMTAIWEQLSSQRDIVIEEMVLEVNSREALDGTIAATWFTQCFYSRRTAAARNALRELLTHADDDYPKVCAPGFGRRAPGEKALPAEDGNA